MNKKDFKRKKRTKEFVSKALTMSPETVNKNSEDISWWRKCKGIFLL